MNIDNSTDIKLREKIFAKSAVCHYMSDISSSDFAAGMYCCAKITCLEKGSVLCILLDSAGRYITEIMLSHDFGRLHDRLYEKIRDFADRFSARKVILARRRLPSADTEYIIAGGIVISNKLESGGIELVSYYLTEEYSYFNILPER